MQLLEDKTMEDIREAFYASYNPKMGNLYVRRYPSEDERVPVWGLGIGVMPWWVTQAHALQALGANIGPYRGANNTFPVDEYMPPHLYRYMLVGEKVRRFLFDSGNLPPSAAKSIVRCAVDCGKGKWASIDRGWPHVWYDVLNIDNWREP